MARLLMAGLRIELKPDQVPASGNIGRHLPDLATDRPTCRHLGMAVPPADPPEKPGQRVPSSAERAEQEPAILDGHVHGRPLFHLGFRRE